LIPYQPPTFKEDAFNCPFCHALSHQKWGIISYPSTGRTNTAFDTAECEHCHHISIWYDGKMVFPLESTAPLAHEDFPKEAIDDYNEARNVLIFSPRSACLLLRLCIEKIVNKLEPGSDDLNDKIKKLVAKGLDPGIQKALDSVRVIGGQAGHSLQMDLKDDAGTANAMFSLVNIIVESTIGKEKKINDMYKKLPKEKVDAINDRDKSKK